METETIKLTSTQIDILIKGYYLKEKGTSVIVKHDVTGAEPLIGESEIPVTVDFRVKILGTGMEKPVPAEVFNMVRTGGENPLAFSHINPFRTSQQSMRVVQ